MPFIIAVLAALLATLSPVLATGTLVCEAYDKTIELTAGVTVGGPRRGTMVNLGGHFEVKTGKVPALSRLPSPLKAFELGKDDFSQLWIDRAGVKLQLYRETAEKPNGYVLVTIETRRFDEGEYRGRYVLETDVAKDGVYGNRPHKLSGKAHCSMD